MGKDDSNNQIRLNLSLSIDRDRYLRRSCPACGRDFKTEINPVDLAWVVAPQIRRMGLEIGDKPYEQPEETSEDYLYCPYCDHRAEASRMLTEHTVRYLYRYLMREVILPRTNRLFSAFGDVPGRSSGLISIHIEHTRSMYPPRPIHGPEPADMKIVEFLCCGKKGKMSDRWYALNVCIFCGTPVALI